MTPCTSPPSTTPRTTWPGPVPHSPKPSNAKPSKPATPRTTPTPSNSPAGKPKKTRSPNTKPATTKPLITPRLPSNRRAPMSDPGEQFPHQRTNAAAKVCCSTPTRVAGHRAATPPPPGRLRQLPLLPPSLHRPPPRRVRITGHRIHLSPRAHRTILCQHRKLKRRIRTLTQQPAQRPPHSMRPPRGPFNDLHRRDTDRARSWSTSESCPAAAHSASRDSNRAAACV